MAEIRYIGGDATAPVGEGRKIIVHCCNDRGAWGSGFVVALSKKWWQPEHHYRAMGEYKLGVVGVVPVSPEIYVANLIGQHGIAGDGDVPPIRYEAIRKGFQLLVRWWDDDRERKPKQMRPALHMPRIGCWLAGGDWALIEPLVETTFIRAGIDVTVYDFPGGDFYDSRDPTSVPFRRKGKPV